MTDEPHPVDGQVVLLTGAKASVPLERIPDLLERVQVDLAPRLDAFRRRFECVHDDGERAVFLVPDDHWRTVGDRLDFGRRERDAVRRAHEEQLLRTSRREDRREEFASALELRTAAVVGRGGTDAPER